MDDRKQWAPLHYAVDANNMYVLSKLTTGEKRFRCGNYSSFLLHYSTCMVFSLPLDININGGNGDNVLHIAAQSKKIWEGVSLKDVIRSDELPP